ncbi:MAG: hypothetical protein LIR50_14635 [Bacillota bacterium]|nr:hypothetical protein [Bacillota bacterium]
MITNVDFDGFYDWSDDELIGAKATIELILNLRKKAKIFDALSKVENAFKELQATTDTIEYCAFEEYKYSIADIFEVIKLHYKDNVL